MTTSELIKRKTDARDTLKKHYQLPKRSKILIWVHFTDSKIVQSIIQGLPFLPANFIVFGSDIETSPAKNIALETSLKEVDMTGIDAMLCDCKEIKLEKIMEVGVVPVINEGNYLGKILQEFRPARAEGNAYKYEDNSYWSAYYALIRYLENHNFPYDNRNLIKNVSSL